MVFLVGLAKKLLGGQNWAHQKNSKNEKKNLVFNYRSYNDKIECLIRFATVQCK